MENVVVREMLNANDPVKNTILSMGDLHLDSVWSKNINDRLYEFMTKLASVAKVSNVSIYQSLKDIKIDAFVLVIKSFYN